MVDVKNLMDILETPYSELCLKDKLKKVMGIIVIGLFAFFLMKMVKDKKKINQHKNKIKYFNPSIEEGIFSNKITWTMRDKPLTDEQVNDFYKHN
jgi:hypothetical protein